MKPAAKRGFYYNDRFKPMHNAPMFSSSDVRENDEVMVYQEDSNKHIKATVTNVEPSTINFKYSNGRTGSYSAKAAIETVTIGEKEFPKVYIS